MWLVADPDTTYRRTIGRLLEYLADQGNSEGRILDLVEAGFRSGRIAPSHWGLTVEEARAVAIEELEDLFEDADTPCAHAVVGRCIYCRGISAKDRRVVALISEGLDTEQIAEELDVSRYTIRSRIRRLRELLGGERMTDLPPLVEQFQKG